MLRECDRTSQRGRGFQRNGEQKRFAPRRPPGLVASPRYNSDLKGPLTAAYAIVQQAPDNTLSFREAGYKVIAYRDVPMCAPQRMNVCYILAMAHAADDEYSEAM